jgi:hypothetical protein
MGLGPCFGVPGTIGASACYQENGNDRGDNNAPSTIYLESSKHKDFGS